MNPLNKQDVANHLLRQGSICVHLDPRVEKVRCPPSLKDQPQIVLQLGLNFPIPIPDLRVDQDGIFGTLSFNRCAFACFCPWDAIFMIVGDSGWGQVWPESVPLELVAEMAKEQPTTSNPQPVAATAGPPPPPKARASEEPATPAIRRRRALPAGWRIIK